MLVRSEAEYHQILREVAGLNGDDMLSIDTEATGLRVYNGDVIRGVSLAYRGREEGVYISVSHPDSFNVSNPQLLAEVLSPKYLWAQPVLHNARYDFSVLSQIGLEPWSGAHSYVDTNILAWLIQENGRHGLKPLGAYYFGEDETAEQQALKELSRIETQAEVYKRLRAELTDKEPAAVTKERAKAIVEEARANRKDWATFTAEDIAAYAAKDAALTLRLHRRLVADPEYARIEPAVDREHAVSEVAFRMTRRGMAVDVAETERLRSDYLQRMAAIQAEFGDVSLDSPKQLAALVYNQWGLEALEVTGTGAPSTSRLALELHQGAHPGIDRILEYRKMQKAVSGFFAQLLDNLDSDGRVHPSFNTIGTNTGRWSCSGPNVQQRPRDAGHLFVAAPGMVLVSGDMSQAELRIGASLACEPSMIERFESGEDIYQGTADTLGITRQESKVVTLSSQYGIGGRKLARSLAKGRQVIECQYWIVAPQDRRGIRRCRACDSCRAKELLEGFWNSVPFLAETNRKLVAFAEEHRYVPLVFPGRFRRYPTPDQCRAMKLSEWPRPWAALNAVIQGTCADVLKAWLLSAEPKLQRIGASFVASIHDSVTVEAPAGTEEEVGKILQSALDDVTPAGWVRIPVDVKIGV